MECLQGLERMYDAAYRADSIGNVGMAKGLADVRLQIGRELWERVEGKKQKLDGETYEKELQGVKQCYGSAMGILTEALRTARSHMDGKQEMEMLVKEGEEIQAELEAELAVTNKGLVQAQEMLRTAKQKSLYVERLKKNPRDEAAADRLVRLYVNESGDVKGAGEYVGQASSKTQEAYGLLGKGAEKLTGTEALVLAGWLEKLDDNAESRNRRGILERAKACYERYLGEAGAGGAEKRTATLGLKRVGIELAKLPKPVVVAVAKAEEKPQEKPVEKPAEVAVKPVEVVVEKPVVVKPRAPKVDEKPKGEGRQSIFDFGR